ncbi:MAG: CBS domain-containing protein [Candidatus Omnitrophica bacterium]|nr:CBS domain-containing protein [Candidatus Omnitrophota bacterium]MCM8802801.1 CBS domain-containing protein [Candidatus Omnitrophota bacterium]
MKKVKDYMEKDITIVNKKTNLSEILKIFSNSYYNIIPVVDENEILCGIVSIEDILENLILSKKEVELLEKFPFFVDAFSEIIGTVECVSSLLIAEDVMNKEVIKINEESSVLKALILMRKHNISCLVVVDEKESPTGFIRRNNILKALGC